MNELSRPAIRNEVTRLSRAVVAVSVPSWLKNQPPHQNLWAIFRLAEGTETVI